MKDKNSLDDELKGLSLWLRDMKRQQGDGFHLPEGYFDALEGLVFSRIDALGARRQPALEARRGGGLSARLLRPQAMVAIAAALALVLAAVWFFLLEPVAEHQIVVAPELSEEDIEAYVLENIRDFEAAQLASLSPEDVETASSVQPEIQPNPEHSLDDLSEEELELLLKEMSDEELESLL